MGKEKKSITKWLDPKQTFQSHYGFITNREWLLKEKDRIESGTGKECVILENDRRQESLFYNQEKHPMKMIFEHEEIKD